MEYLNWMAEHYILTVILAAIAAQALIGVAAAIRG